MSGALVPRAEPRVLARERSGVVLAAVTLSIAGLAIAHDLLAIVLDRAELVERLLSPSGELELASALLAGLVLFGLRLTLLVLAPALVLGLLGAWVTTLFFRASAPASASAPAPTSVAHRVRVVLSGRADPACDRQHGGPCDRDRRAGHPSDDPSPRPR